jgi:hypothetical protein
MAGVVSAYGTSVKPKLANIAIGGAPEDQLRGPLEFLWRDLAEISGLPVGSVHLVGETTLADLKTRPDFAATVGKALVAAAQGEEQEIVGISWAAGISPGHGSHRPAISRMIR